jgi:hypothetical protein
MVHTVTEPPVFHLTTCHISTAPTWLSYKYILINLHGVISITLGPCYFVMQADKDHGH